MTGSRIALPLAFACACAIGALTVVPRGIEAQALLSMQDDPAALADRALDRLFNPAVVAREIEAALAADDADLAKSFLDLARDRHVEVDAALAARVDAANSTAAAAARNASSFGRGLLTGEPDDLVGLAGSAVGDLFVFGDIRDTVREGSRLVRGEHADPLILGLACVGLAITAGTYFSFGAAAPARIGASVVKVARRTGRMTTQMTEWFGRAMRDVVDWPKLQRALASASITEPAVAVRAAREAVKAEKSGELMRVIGDVGRVQSKAGTQAAVEGLKLAESPREISRVALLAEKKGTRTRAILKTLGRGAFLLTSSAFSLFSWMFTAVMMVWGFCSAIKRMAERATERYCERRRSRRTRERLRFAAMAAG
jgi:hypothetical protein